jgi:hypothetical protein
VALAVGIAAVTSTSGPGARSHAQPRPAGALGAARSYPVDQLPPGHVTLAHARTPDGAVAITLHRIRYFGHVSLCVNETHDGGGSEGCARYPLGPHSNQPIGDAPVWWATDYMQACTKARFQVVSGIVLRGGLTAWLRSSGGVTRMPTTAIPKAFGVAGGLIYATTGDAPASVSLRNAQGAVVYSEPVVSVAQLPSVSCRPETGNASVSVSVSSHTIP